MLLSRVIQTSHKITIAALFVTIVGAASFFSYSLYKEKQIACIGAVAKALEIRDYSLVSRLLRQHVDTTVSVAALEAVQDSSFSRALHKAESIKQMDAALRISLKELLLCTFFIETELPSSIENHKYYLKKEETGLSCNLEYDPETKLCFILLEGIKGGRIGRGKFKKVWKAVLYAQDRVEIVARAEQRLPMEKEVAMMRCLRGVPGIFETIAFTRHEDAGIQYTTVYSKLYTHSSLQKLFDKKVALDTTDKVAIARQILQGLQELHKRHILHCDLGARNYLVAILQNEHKKQVKRQVRCVISDFGRAVLLDEVNTAARLQGNTSYIAPEALFRESMQEADYFASEVFAVGCVLYNLFYEKRAGWQLPHYGQDTRERAVVYDEYVQHIRTLRDERYRVLSEKVQSGSKLSVEEQFEHLVLKMVDPDPKARGSAAELAVLFEAML